MPCLAIRNQGNEEPTVSLYIIGRRILAITSRRMIRVLPIHLYVRAGEAMRQVVSPVLVNRIWVRVCQVR
jgi:hypothetical protein